MKDLILFLVLIIALYLAFISIFKDVSIRAKYEHQVKKNCKNCNNRFGSYCYYPMHKHIEFDHVCDKFHADIEILREMHKTPKPPKDYNYRKGEE